MIHITPKLRFTSHRVFIAASLIRHENPKLFRMFTVRRRFRYPSADLVTTLPVLNSLIDNVSRAVSRRSLGGHRPTRRT